MRSVLVGCLLAAAASAQAQQARWIIDPKASLAWWQVDPHLNHLWATTCPQDPDWRPGEGHSGGWAINKSLKLPRVGYGNVSDTSRLPMFPRKVVRQICSEAVRGQVLVPDTLSWRGARGQIAVQGDALVTGETMRDVFAHQAVLQTSRYPEIRFTLDSLLNMARHADTIRGTAAGTFSLHGVAKPVTAIVKAWPEAGGIRVLARLTFPAQMLLDEYGFSRFALGLGVVTGIWKDVYMGADLLMRLEARGAN